MANTVIGSSIVIDGEISGDEDLIIQGTVKGKISLKESLIVEKSGVVEADIETQNVEIGGQVTGNIAATDKVELKSDCRVIGDIKAPRILIADGASFKGNVDMEVAKGGGDRGGKGR
jgi:cytoskeletal protein CcmA (bactofilin family)